MLETLSRRLGKPLTALAAMLVLVATAGLSAVASVGNDDEKKVKKVKVQKIIHETCEGDCEEGEHMVRKVFIGEDGEVKEFEGDHDVWISEDAKVHVIKMGAHHEDCEGDCDGSAHVVRKIFIGEDGEIEEAGGEGHVWIGSDDAKVHVIKMGGHGGEIHRAHFGMHGKGGFLGVQLTELTAELREHFGVPGDAGVMVSKVIDDTPAAKAGIKVGDIISGVDGETVSSAGELAHKIRQLDEGATPALEVWRAGKVETMTAAIEVREAPRMMGGMPGAHKLHRIKVMCDDGEDCDVEVDQDFEIGEFDCGGTSECNVMVKCEDSGCECSINGEPSDCEEIPGFSELHGE